MPITDDQFTAALARIAVIEARLGINQPVPIPDPVTPVREPVAAIGLVRSGKVENKLITTAPKREIGIQVIGDGVTIRDVEFAPNGGYLVQVNNTGTVIDGLEATTFTDYALYVQGAKDTTVRRMNVVGGSTNESILRLDNVDGFTLEDSTLDYRPVSKRKAVIRGFGTGININRVKFYGGGAVAGTTPMTGFDGGEGYIAGGMLRTYEPQNGGYIVNVENRADWVAAVKAAVAEGAVEHEDIMRRVLDRVPVKIKVKGAIVTLPASKIDVGRTAVERVKYLAQRAEATFTACDFIDAPIRNSAGGTQRYFDCKITGEPFTGWNEPTYPNPQYVLPKDIKRPAPVTEFTRCAFSWTGWPQAQFESFCIANGIRLVSCSFNGMPLRESPVD